MQKVYSRRNWENSPSTNTPLGENNLNAMDYAIDEIDNRVVSLSGYQDRAAESEENAKTSENNAKQSELNAKQSELLAKEYKDKAFTYTPDGYEEMVDEVFGLDIKSSTKSPLLNTRNGGLRFNTIKGKSEQNTEPTPTNPVSIKNAFECVELMQGGYNSTTGIYASNSARVCTKNQLPCVSGDVVKIATEKTPVANGYQIVFFNNGTYLSSSVGSGTNNEFSATVPSGATSFVVSLVFSESTTPSTVGKVKLTINGKVLVPIKTVGKNLLDCRGLKTTTMNGVTFTPIYNASGELEYINVNGTAATNTWFNTIDKLMPSGSYVLNTNSNYSQTTHMGYMVNASGTTVGNEWDNGGKFTLNDDTLGHFVIFVRSGITVSNAKYYPMVRRAEVEDATYEPYKESNAYIKLSDSLRGIGDVKDEIVKQNGVWGVLRRFAEETFDGSADERARFSYSLIGDGVSYRWVISTPNAKIFTDGYKTANILSSRYAPIPSNSLWAGMQGISVAASSRNLLIFSDELNDDDNSTIIESFSENPLTVVYELATPTFEELDADSQIALNSLETFDGATSISFDSVVQPTFEVEYGESKVGAYTLKALNTSESNEIRYKELAVALLALES